MMTPARIGIWTGLATLLVDQASKVGLLFGYDLPVRDPVDLTPFLTLTVVWNRGVSYGMFQQHTDWGRWILTVFSLAAALALAIWIHRCGSRFLAAALGLIAGGALGNAIDRVAYGAVFDFVHLHAGGYSWYVFNIADAAIVAGVVGLIYDSLIAGRPASSRA